MAKGPTFQIDLAAIDDAVADAAVPAEVDTDIELDEETAAEVAELKKLVRRAVYNPADGSVSYKLRYPRQLIRGGKVEFDATTLVFRQPKANLAQIVMTTKDNQATLAKMLVELVDDLTLPYARLLIDKFDARDMTAIMGIIGFFSGGLSGADKTG
jgi:hypothetical protein